MTLLDRQTMKDAPRSGAVNGRLWGARARDWADLQEPQCGPAYIEVLDRGAVGAGTRLLDAGCGSGAALGFAIDLGATVTGIDAAPGLLEIARARLPRASFHEGDLEDLPFDDASFDVVTGFNSFQYAADPVAALREAGRVTRPGGRVFLMTWGDPAAMEASALVAALKPLLPAPPPGAPGPFALSEPGRLEALSRDAGPTPVEVFDIDLAWSYPDLATGQRALGSAGVAVRAAEQSGQAALDAAHAAALAPFRQPDGSYRVGARFRVLMAEVAK